MEKEKNIMVINWYLKGKLINGFRIAYDDYNKLILKEPYLSEIKKD